jgi:hypothetical protein
MLIWFGRDFKGLKDKKKEENKNTNGQRLYHHEPGLNIAWIGF